VPTSMDFGEVQTAAHDEAPPSSIVPAPAGISCRTPRHAARRGCGVPQRRPRRFVTE
jgi:hypothetical protein